MSQTSPSGSGPAGPWPDDDRDPDTSLKSLVAAVEAGQHEPPPDQGLYVCVPPEQLTLEGFAQHGVAGTMTPGPLLAAIAGPGATGPETAGPGAAPDTADTATGLRALSDDQLIGVVSAARRLECRAAWTQLTAIAALATRRQDPARPDKPRPRRGTPIESAADELAAELHLTWQSAVGHISYAATVTQRLPRCLATMQTIMTHFGWLNLHARSVPARLSGGEERMGFRLLVQRFGRQVDAARPDDRPGLKINCDLSEVGGVIQWREDARPPFTGEIDIPGSAVAEQQAQHAVTDHGDTHHGWQVAHIHDLHVTPAGRCRAGAHSAVPVPSSPGSHRT